MRQDIRVLDRVRGAYASLRPSEQRVADYVLKDPETAAAARPGRPASTTWEAST